MTMKEVLKECVISARPWLQCDLPGMSRIRSTSLPWKRLTINHPGPGCNL